MIFESLAMGKDWLSVSEEGIVTGIVADGSAEYRATLIAENARGDRDSQTIVIPVHQVLGVDSRLPESASPAIRAYPNPFAATTAIGIEAPATGSMRIDVVSLAGNFVRSLFAGGVNAGQHIAAQWDGTTTAGAPMPNGAYLITVSSTRDKGTPPWRAHRLVVISR